MAECRGGVFSDDVQYTIGLLTRQEGYNYVRFGLSVFSLVRFGRMINVKCYQV